VSLIKKVENYIREQLLIRPGERIAVAISGGADSVALVRILLVLRSEFGVVLSVAHFNHRIRGADADADEQFVKALAEKFQLECHCGNADVPAYSTEHKLSLETAAREVRQRWFGELVQQGKADKVATAHTLDDQAETVLMRILRGAGGRGLAGIAPRRQEKNLIRPLLAITRPEIEEYLRGLKQSWREDATNHNLHHTRNRIRHELLPLLERDYNPALRQQLASLADIARAEEEYWEKEIPGLVSRLIRSGKPSRSGRSSGPAESPVRALDLAPFQALPLAVQRRLLRAMGEQFDTALEYHHVQQLLTLIHEKQSGKELPLPGGLVATRSFRELQIRQEEAEALQEGYCYRLVVPGEVEIPELKVKIRAQLVSAGNNISGYNSALLNRAMLAPELTVRNWRPGDRFFPAHTRSPRKVKELLQPARLGHEVSPAERRAWPVIESAGEIVWMRGFSVPQAYAAIAGQGIVIEETTINLGSEAGN
jgi:tRNA(Ile)-lysidine synthase